jgi:hypothetical protein
VNTVVIKLIQYTDLKVRARYTSRLPLGYSLAILKIVVCSCAHRDRTLIHNGGTILALMLTDGASVTLYTWKIGLYICGAGILNTLANHSK